ncbi:MAG: type II toxin-antitoxin system VapC family toxin [Thermoleophilaceae bacterium]
MTRFLYDTAVFLYAIGGAHPYRAPCRSVLERAEGSRIEGDASADLVQEVLHHRFRRTGDRSRAAREARDAAAACRLHEVRPEDVQRALDLFAGAQRLSARDAVFAAVALNRGIGAILSPDKAFDEVPGLARVDPADREAAAALYA